MSQSKTEESIKYVLRLKEFFYSPFMQFYCSRLIKNALKNNIKCACRLKRVGNTITISTMKSMFNYQGEPILTVLFVTSGDTHILERVDINDIYVCDIQKLSFAECVDLELIFDYLRIIDIDIFRDISINTEDDLTTILSKFKAIYKDKQNSK